MWWIRLAAAERIPVLESQTVTLGRQNCDLILQDKSVSRQHALISCAKGVLWLEDKNSRFGVRLNGQAVSVGKVQLQDQDQIVLGAAESESISVEKEELLCSLYLPEPEMECPLIPFDAKVSSQLAGSTHFLVPDGSPLDARICTAMILGIPLVTPESLGLSQRKTPTIIHKNQPVSIETRTNLLKGFNVLDVDEQVRELLKLLGATSELVHQKGSMNVRLAGNMNLLFDAILSGNSALLEELKVVVSEETKQEADYAVVSSDKKLVRRPEITTPGDSEVKMVVTYVDLYRPSPTSTQAVSTIPSGVKRFKKTQPARKPATASECIGLADMAPYRSVMVTGGVNVSKTEAWLDDVHEHNGPTKSKPTPAPAASTTVNPPKFKSSFFSEGFNFD